MQSRRKDKLAVYNYYPDVQIAQDVYDHIKKTPGALDQIRHIESQGNGIEELYLNEVGDIMVKITFKPTQITHRMKLQDAAGVYTAEFNDIPFDTHTQAEIHRYLEANPDRDINEVITNLRKYL